LIFLSRVFFSFFEILRISQTSLLLLLLSLSQVMESTRRYDNSVEFHKCFWLIRERDDDNYSKALKILTTELDVDTHWLSVDADWYIETMRNTILVHSCLCEYHTLTKAIIDHPSTDVNETNFIGSTALMIVCNKGGSLHAIRVLLDDERVNAAIVNRYGISAMWLSCYHGYIDTMKLLIASGKELGDAHMNLTTSDICVMDGRTNLSTLPDVVNLIKRFAENQTLTRHEIRIELGYKNEVSASTFSLVIFMCDGYLELSSSDKKQKTVRFFRMLQMLPMELQMIVCNRAAGSGKTNIPTKHSESAFKYIVSLFSS